MKELLGKISVILYMNTLFHLKSASEIATYIKIHHLKQQCPTPILRKHFINKNRESTRIALWCMFSLLSFPSSPLLPFLPWTLYLCFIYMLFCTCFLLPFIWFTWLIFIHLLRFNTSIISSKAFRDSPDCEVLCLPR